MTAINSINVNAQGIGNSYGYNTKAKSEDKKADQAEVQTAGQQKSVPAEDVLSFMAQSAVSVTPAKSVDPAKYVDEESAKRIAGFMAQFEDIVATNLTAISKEFPEMSEGAKQSLALSQVKA